jgi:DNA-binding IscR family transcriptional regulator
MKKKKKSSVDAQNSAISQSKTAPQGLGWTFLSNHTHVLLCLYRDNECTLREVASLVGITERMVQKIVAELVEAKFIEVAKLGRRNTYAIQLGMTLRHPLESHCKIGDLLEHLKQG